MSLIYDGIKYVSRELHRPPLVTNLRLAACSYTNINIQNAPGSVFPLYFRPYKFRITVSV